MAGAGSSRDGGRGRSAGRAAGARRNAKTVAPAKPVPAVKSARASAASSNGGVLKVTIPSDYDAGRDVQDRILKDVQRHGFSTDNTFAIRIALEEALVNAIKHGNRHNPDKKVHVEAKVTRQRAEITIEDEGPGFKRGEIPDPTLSENLHKCSGRGILLIESYMDGVHWSRGGRRLKMVKENA